MGAQSRTTAEMHPQRAAPGASAGLALGAKGPGRDGAAGLQSAGLALYPSSAGETENAVDLIPTHDLDRVARQMMQSVLVLEDDRDFGSMILEYLLAQGYLATLVRSGAEGLKKVMAEDVDIILCDMVMPHLAGDMFYFAVTRIKPHLSDRFIFMTGHQNNPKIAIFIRDVKGTILYKPFPLLALDEQFLALSRKINGGAGGQRRGD